MSSRCVADLWRRRRRRNPKITKTMRATPPITPPMIPPTGVELFLEVGVPETPLLLLVEVACWVVDVVVDVDVPFWTMRKSNVRGDDIPS